MVALSAWNTQYIISEVYLHIKKWYNLGRLRIGAPPRSNKITSLIP